jgi:glycosyltransferase involved in cell wall biosynthesis
LHTTLAFYLESHAHKQRDEAFMRDFARPMLDLERTMFAQSDAILANSKAIVQQIEDRYSIVFHEDRLAIVPHGQEDWTPLAAKAPRPLPDGGVRLVFVGRLEERKGIDVLLAALDKVLSSRPFLSADIVGNDRLPSGDGRTFREAWENENTAKSYARRVRFHGEVDDEVLRGFYRAADIFVAPSRFESFGLIFLEAMMCGKPMIGCRAGGMPEVIREGLTGLLAEPGDVESLANAIARLADDAALRARLGQAARADYEARFTPALMANGALAFLARFARGAHQRQPCKGERCDPSGPERSPPAASRRADQQHRRAQ